MHARKLGSLLLGHARGVLRHPGKFAVDQIKVDNGQADVHCPWLHLQGVL